MRPIAAGALIATLAIAPSAAAQPPRAAPKPAWIEAAPILTTSRTMRLRNDLLIMRAGLESYRAGHFYRYPEAGSLEDLIALLILTDDLPEGFKVQGAVTEFTANRGGYRISARTDGDTLTIRPPERFDPFWAMLW